MALVVIDAVPARPRTLRSSGSQSMCVAGPGQGLLDRVAPQRTLRLYAIVPYVAARNAAPLSRRLPTMKPWGYDVLI